VWNLLRWVKHIVIGKHKRKSEEKLSLMGLDCRIAVGSLSGKFILMTIVIHNKGWYKSMMGISKSRKGWELLLIGWSYKKVETSSHIWCKLLKALPWRQGRPRQKQVTTCFTNNSQTFWWWHCQDYGSSSTRPTYISWYMWLDNTKIRMLQDLVEALMRKYKFKMDIASDRSSPWAMKKR
jgi:hypothetical protein